MQKYNIFSNNMTKTSIYLHSQKKDALHMQKKCKPNAMELAPIAEMQPFFYKNTIFFRIT